MTKSVRQVGPLGLPPWETEDPFLFCVHHDDAYPRANARLGPDAPLVGRQLGMDFAGQDGWRMYHGRVVPGFPQHPHRGFETITVVRTGYVDHSDSLGATARYGQGDVQWMTAGRGIVHAEMFPLLEVDSPNPLELFQIWLNLPRADKMVEPHFSMLWSQDIPRVAVLDDAGRPTEVTVIAGAFQDGKPRSPPPRSWAARAHADVAVWTIRMDAGARWQLPPTRPGVNRSLFFFRGSKLRVDTMQLDGPHRISLEPTAAPWLEAGPEECELLLLQGRPIGEPIVQHGPFVMTTREEIAQAFHDYRATGFGGWPWPSDDPVHERTTGRFAKHADGTVERRG